MEQVLSQAPVGISDEIIKEIFIKNKENVVDSLTELWHITENIKNKEYTKWDEIRETCDAFDAEMNNFMKQMKQNQSQKQEQQQEQQEQIQEEQEQEQIQSNETV